MGSEMCIRDRDMGIFRKHVNQSKSSPVKPDAEPPITSQITNKIRNRINKEKISTNRGLPKKRYFID